LQKFGYNAGIAFSRLSGQLLLGLRASQGKKCVSRSISKFAMAARPSWRASKKTFAPDAFQVDDLNQ
jgi:hypothetical protein